MYNFDFNYWRKLGGEKGQEPYVDNVWMQNRVFIDGDFCKDYEEFKTKSAVATTAYYFREQPITGKMVRTNRPALAKAPLYLVEYIESHNIFRLWLNVTIEDEETYTQAKEEAAAIRKQQEELTKKHGHAMAKLYDNYPKCETTKYCSLANIGAE